MDAAKIVLAVLAVVGLFYFSLNIGRIAREKYGLRLFTSVSFGAVLSGAIFAFLGGYTLYMSNTEQSGISHQDLVNCVIYFAAAILSACFALYRNIRCSNLVFGLVFSLVQLVTATLIVAIVAWFVIKKFPKRFSPLHVPQ